MKRALILCASATVLISGCGGKQIDGKKVEKLIRDRLAARGQAAQVKSISCPSGQKLKQGATFECSLVGVDNSKARLLVQQIDGKGTVKVIRALPGG